MNKAMSIQLLKQNLAIMLRSAEVLSCRELIEFLIPALRPAKPLNYMIEVFGTALNSIAPLAEKWGALIKV